MARSVNARGINLVKISQFLGHTALGLKPIQ
jgi:hypothetical protein